MTLPWNSDGSWAVHSHLLAKWHVCEIERERKKLVDYVGSTISESLRFILSNFFESKDAMKRWQRRVKSDNQLWEKQTPHCRSILSHPLFPSMDICSSLLKCCQVWMQYLWDTMVTFVILSCSKICHQCLKVLTLLGKVFKELKLVKRFKLLTVTIHCLQRVVWYSMSVL